MPDQVAPKYSYSNVEIVRIVDGDTVVAVVDLGFRVRMEMPLRIYGINTPERAQANHDEAIAALTKILKMRPTKARPEPRTKVSVNTIKPADKYGRYLAEIFLADGTTVAERMIATGLATPYFGGAR
jgi:endonuclease YncB( thermonuclease family)